MTNDVLVEGAPVVLVGEPQGLLAFSTDTPQLRPRWFDGRLLAPAVLQIEQQYRRFLAQTGAGSGGAGVVSGLEVGTAGATGQVRFTVTPGLAINADGRVLLLLQSLEVALGTLLPGADAGTPVQLFVLALAPDEQDLAPPAAGSPSRVREGVQLRASPYAWRLPAAGKGTALDPVLHLRSLAASDYLRAARAEQASLISGAGLRAPGWCRGAGPVAGDQVPLALVAVAGGHVLFVDRWAARRERLTEPQGCRATFVHAMRPPELFLAEVLQFQCQLASGDGVQPLPSGSPAPAPMCLELHALLSETHAAFTGLLELDAAPVLTEEKARTLRATEAAPVLAEEMPTLQALPLPGGRSALFALTRKVADQLAPPRDPTRSLLLEQGFVELPPAGYLPVTSRPSVNEQARALFGPGVDVRVCVARPDMLAHALEEAAHMERISLVEGLADPTRRPEVDVLVPDGVPRTAPPPEGAYGLVLRLGADKQSPGRLRGVLRLNERRDGSLAAYAAAFGTGQRLIFDVVSLFGGRSAAWQAQRQRREVPAGIAYSLAHDWTRGALVDEAGTALDGRLGQVNGLWLTFEMERDPVGLRPGQRAGFSVQLFLAAAGDRRGALRVEVEGVFSASRVVTATGEVYGTLDLRLAVSRLRPRRNDPAERLRTRRLLLPARALPRPNGRAMRIRRPGGGEVSLEIARGSDGTLTGLIALAQTAFDSQDPLRELPLMRLDASEDATVVQPANASHRLAELGLEVVAAATATGAELRRQAEALLFAPRPRSDELIVDATRNFVLFHRRRTRRCVTLPRPAPEAPQLLRVLAASAASAEEAAQLAAAIIASVPQQVAGLRQRLAVDAASPVVFEFPPRTPRPVESAGLVTAGLRALGMTGLVQAAIVARAGAPALALARATNLLGALPPETPVPAGLVVQPTAAVPTACTSFAATAVLVLITVPDQPEPG